MNYLLVYSFNTHPHKRTHMHNFLPITINVFVGSDVNMPSLESAVKLNVIGDLTTSQIDPGKVPTPFTKVNPASDDKHIEESFTIAVMF